MPDEPTLAEVLRIVTKVEATLEQMVRRDIYESHREADREDVRELKARLDRAEEERRQDRRLLMTSFVLPLALIVLQLYLASQGVNGS